MRQWTAVVSHPVWPPSLLTLPSYSPPLLTGRHLDSNRVYCQLEKKITAPNITFWCKMAGQQNAPGPLCFQLCSDFICWLLQLPLKTVLHWNPVLGSLVANKSTKTKAVHEKANSWKMHEERGNRTRRPRQQSSANANAGTNDKNTSGHKGHDKRAAVWRLCCEWSRTLKLWPN